MNSHQRRTTERFWPHGAHLQCSDQELDECLKWLTETFGSCSFKRRKTPLWCYRPEYIPGRGNFTMHSYGASIFFRRERDYTAFLLRWEQ